ncbi:MAG: hypothetical protein Q4B52_02935 [Tissierellia bacterium]|nr:hypothetical protein [Tissierellia bacterium]
MKIDIIKDKKIIYSKEINNIDQLNINYNLIADYIEIKMERNFDKVKLLAILSPLFMTMFNSDNFSFFNFLNERSKYQFAIFPNFFDFDESKYMKHLEEDKLYEDIIYGKDIIYRINFMKDHYLTALIALLFYYIEDDKKRIELLDYFSGMKDRTVINGRRSALANGLRGFYLSKYIAVWLKDLFEEIKEEDKHYFSYIKEVYELNENLRDIRKS